MPSFPAPRLFAGTVLIVLSLLPWVAAATAPLTLPGATVLYQRVLTKPGAEASDTPGTKGGHLISALSRLYVYERRRSDGQEWLRVGTDSAGKNLLGWVPENETLVWNQQLTLALTNPAGRERLTFFRDWDSLRSVLDSPAPAATGRAIVEGIASGMPDPRVVALEPETYVDIYDRFYLLPILDLKNYTNSAGNPMRALKVASVTLPEPGSASRAAAPPTSEADAQAQAEQLRSFKAAIVFVVDSSISMGPYIEETREAVARFYDRIRAAGLLHKVAFGLVAFRAQSANPQTNRQLDYVARVYAAPTQVRNGKDFLARVAALREAPVATDHFDEDPYAGVLAALEMPEWLDRFDARYIVLVTDAGALDGTLNAPSGAVPGPGQPVQGVDSSTGLNAAAVQDLARRDGVAISVMHLQTQEARRVSNLQRAAEQYKELARNAMNQQDAYFPVADGNRERFRAAIDTFAEVVIGQIAQTARGQAAPADGTARAPSAAPQDATDDKDQHARIQVIVASLGHAMQLAYLGERRQSAAPEVFEAWISDTDLADPGLRTVDVRVLMTRDQLSDLKELVSQVIDTAQADLEGTGTTQDFYDRLASIAAAFERDPTATGRRRAPELAQRELLLQYLEGLPYKSDVLDLKKSDWTSWGLQRQADFVDRLRKKVLLYSRYYADSFGWIDIAQTDNPRNREAVYPIPLKDLP
jgi:serine/threonine-protein kinase PpkA